MTDPLQIFCKNTNEYISVKGGETLLEIYERIKDKIGFTPICAHVNNKTEDLHFPVYKPNMVEFLDLTSASGQRVYIRSLCMVLYKAVLDVCPGMRLRIRHSVSNGYYAQLTGKDNNEIEPCNEKVDGIKARMQEIINEDIPFIRRQRLIKDVIGIFEEAGLDDKVELLKTSGDIYSIYYTLGDTPDSYYGNLAPSTGSLKVFDLIKYRNGMLLLGPDKTDRSKPRTPIRQDKMFEAFTDYLEFNEVVGITNVADLNNAVLNDNASMLINVAEALHNAKFSQIADRIASRYHEGCARIVLIAGPSSSGKTTSSKRLAIQLMINRIVPKVISLDNYFVNREDTPKDENGDYDYESLHALDLELFNSDMRKLINGEEVDMPTYDFASGKRVFKGEKMKLDRNNVLLIEGIHGLNPELTSLIPEEQKFRVYVSALTTLTIDDHNWVPTTDNRLLRRIIRDHKYRGVDALETIARWQNVRKGEEKWIFPFQENADATFNSSLLFELGVMKEYAEPLLRKVPRNVPEFAEAVRLLTFLNYFLPISEKQIPSTSLLREFLGGSSFHY